MDTFSAAPDESGSDNQNTALPFDEMQVRRLDNGLTGALRTVIRHPESGLAALPAEQALAAVAEALASIDRIGETWLDRAGTPRQKSLALPVIDARLERARGEIDAIVQRAKGEIDDRSVEERLSGLQQDAALAWKDRRWLRVLGRTAVNERRQQGERNGWDKGRSEVNVRRGLSDVYAGAVEAAMAEDIDGAGALLAHAHDAILPERQQALERRLVETREDQRVTGIDNALAALPLDPVAPPSSEGYRARAEELTPDDAAPGLRSRIALLAEGAHRRATKQWQAERNRAGLSAIDWMIANPGAPVATMDRNVVSKLAPEQLVRLQEIEAKGRLDTDPDAYGTPRPDGGLRSQNLRRHRSRPVPPRARRQGLRAIYGFPEGRRRLGAL